MQDYSIYSALTIEILHAVLHLAIEIMPTECSHKNIKSSWFEIQKLSYTTVLVHNNHHWSSVCHFLVIITNQKLGNW